MELLFMERKRIMDRSFYQYVDTMKNLRREEESVNHADQSKSAGGRSWFADIRNVLRGRNGRMGREGRFPCGNKPMNMSEQEKSDLLETGCGSSEQRKILAYLNGFQSYGYKNEPVIDLCTREVFSAPNLYYTDGVYEWDLFEVYDYAKYNRELNKNFVDYLKEKENKEYSNIVFGWNAAILDRWPEADAVGQSVFVDTDGLLTYMEYGSNFKKVEEKCRLSVQVLSQLRKMIDSYSFCVDFLDRSHMPQEGQMSSFIFNGTKIEAWNIRYHHIEPRQFEDTEQDREK